MIHMMHMHSIEPIEPDSKIVFTIRPQDSGMNTRLPYYVSFLLAGLLTLLTIVLQNYEFLLYAITVARPACGCSTSGCSCIFAAAWRLTRGYGFTTWC
jgi:hypothetical protein